MQYDPVKDALGRAFSQTPLLQKLFYRLLDFFFLRAWYVQRELRRLFAAYPAGRAVRVLDAGTGFGQYAYFMARSFPNAHILAVDIKPDYLENARRFLDRTPYGARVQTAIEDLTRLEAPGPFDLVLSVDVMEHIEDDRTVFRNFARVLAPGGHVLINTPSDQGGSDVQGEGQESFIGEHVRDGYNRAALEEKLRAAGLEPVRSLYTYGRYGSAAWRLMIKYPILMMNTSRAAVLLLPLYYLPVAPLGYLLHRADLRRPNPTGTGLLVVARKPAA